MPVNIGPKIGIDGEAQYRKELNNIIQQAKTLSSEMKAVTSAFDENTSAEEKSASTAGVLSKQINVQRQRMSMLADMVGKSAQEYGEADTKTLKWQQALNDATAELNRMERELRESAGKADDLGNALDESSADAQKASGRFDGIGTALKGMAATAATAVAAATAAIAGLTKSFLDLAESTREYREDQSKLDAAFVTAGFTTEQASAAYTDFYSIIGEEDRSVEAVNHLAKLCSTEEELSQWTDIAAGVWATFGDSLPIEGLTEAANETAKTGQIVGQLADALNWAGVSEDEFQASLDGCNSEQERAALITNTLNGLYQEAADNYRQVNGDVMDAQRAQAKLTDAYAELGAIAEPVMTSLKTMAADALGAITPFVSMIGEGLQGVLSGSAGAADTFAEGISGLAQALVDQLSTVAPMIGEVIMTALPVLLDAGVDIITTLIQGIVAALPQLVSAAASIIMQLVNSLIDMLPQILQAAVQIILALANGISQSLPQLIPAIVGAVVQVVQTLIENMPMLLDAALQLMTALAQGLLDALPILIEALPAIITGIIDYLLGAIPQIIQAGIQLLESLVAALPQIVASIVAAIPQIIEGIITAVMESIPQIVQAGIDLLVSLVQNLPEIITTLVAAIPQIISGLVDAILNSIPQIIQAGIDLFVSLIENLPTIIVEIVKAVPQIIEGIISAFGQLAYKIVDIGGDLISGLWEGIQNMASWLWDKISGFFGGIVDGIKGFFGISSPSKVFAEIGEYSGMGFEQGLSSSMGDAFKTAKKELSAGMNGIDAAVAVTGARAPSMASSMQTMNYGGFTINVYGAQGQSEQQLAEEISIIIQNQMNRKKAVFA